MAAATNFAIAKLRNNGIATTMMATHDSNTTEKKTTDKSPRGYKNGAWSLKKKHGETESNSQ